MKGDIILTYDSSLISRAIRLVTKTSYSHVAICFDDNDYIIAESWWTGVRLTKLNNKGNTFIKLRHKELTQEQKDQIIAFIYSKIDYKYDYKLILGLALNRFFKLNINLDDPSRYICLELILEAYKHIGIDLLDSVINRSPGELMQSTKLTLI